MNLGDTIKMIRSEKKLTQTSLANKSLITQTYLSQIESNSKEPNVSTLKKISNGLDIPLPILFFLSIDNEDIVEEKREAYAMIEKSMKSLVCNFFLYNND